MYTGLECTYTNVLTVEAYCVRQGKLMIKICGTVYIIELVKKVGKLKFKQSSFSQISTQEYDQRMELFYKMLFMEQTSHRNLIDNAKSKASTTKG